MRRVECRSGRRHGAGGRLGRPLRGGLGRLFDEVRLLTDCGSRSHGARRPRGRGLLGGAARRGHERRRRRRAVEAGEELLLPIDDAGGRHLRDPEGPCGGRVGIDVDPHGLEARREQGDGFCGRKNIAGECGPRFGRVRETDHEHGPVADECGLGCRGETGMPGHDGIGNERGGRRVGPSERGGAGSQAGAYGETTETGKPKAA